MYANPREKEFWRRMSLSSLSVCSNKYGWTKNCKLSSLLKSSDRFTKTYVQCTYSSAYKQGTAHPGSTSEHQLLRQQHHTRVTVLSLTRGKDWHRREEIVEVVVFVFFTHKKYSRSFIKLRLNNWCHMDHFNDVLTRGCKKISIHESINI